MGNTNKPYRIHYINHIYVIRGHWQSKKGQTKRFLKMKSFENAPVDRIFCIISHMIPTTFISYIFFNMKYVLSNTHILISYMSILYYIIYEIDLNLEMPLL